MTKDKNYKDKYKRQNYFDKDKRGKVQQSTEATQRTRLARFVLDSCPQLWKVDSKKMFYSQPLLAQRTNNFVKKNY